MPAFYNGRQLGQGEFAVVLDGITYVGSATSFNVSRVATDSLARVELSGVVTDREGTVDAIDAHLDSLLDRPAPAPVEPEVPQPQLHVQYVDYNNLPVRGREDCLYVISRYDALGPDVELPCAYVYRPTAHDASPGTLNTLPYQPTNISARLLRALYSQGDRFPRPRRNGDGRLLLHRVAGARPIWSTALLLSNELVHFEPEMLCDISGPTLGARGAVPAQSATAAVHPAEAPMGSRPQIMVQIVPWSQLPVVGDHDTLYCVQYGELGGEGREVFEENAYVYRPGGPDDPRPYKATNVSATTVARVHRSGDRLHSVAAIMRDSSGVPVCYVTSASTVPREVRTRNDVLAWIPTGWRAIGDIPTRGRPGHHAVPAVSSGASSISVPQVSPQTARDIMTRGWGTSLASTTLVEELPTHLPAPPTDVAVPGNLVREQYPITFVPGAARELAARMMDEANDAVAVEVDREFARLHIAAVENTRRALEQARLRAEDVDLRLESLEQTRERIAANSIAEFNAESDRQFTAAVDAVLNTQTDPAVVADLVDGMATVEAPEADGHSCIFLLVRHVSHHDALPEVGDTEALYCVFGYPMAFIYCTGVRQTVEGERFSTDGYFPTNVNAEELARARPDGSFMRAFWSGHRPAAHYVRFACNPGRTTSAAFQVDAAFSLTNGPSALWTNGPWFRRRDYVDNAAVDHGPNRNGDDFTNAVGTFDRISLPRIQADGVFQRVYPTVRQTFPAPDLPNLDQPASAAPASSPPPAPNRRRLILD